LRLRFVGQALSDMNCTVRKGSPGTKEEVAGRRGPWVGVIADALDLECRGAPLAKEPDAETLATCWWVVRHVELIEARRIHCRGDLVRVFASTKLKRGP
jgi:hypothetical protein